MPAGLVRSSWRGGPGIGDDDKEEEAEEGAEEEEEEEEEQEEDGEKERAIAVFVVVVDDGDDDGSERDSEGNAHWESSSIFLQTCNTVSTSTYTEWVRFVFPLLQFLFFFFYIPKGKDSRHRHRKGGPVSHARQRAEDGVQKVAKSAMLLSTQWLMLCRLSLSLSNEYEGFTKYKEKNVDVASSKRIAASAAESISPPLQSCYRPPDALSGRRPSEKLSPFWDVADGWGDHGPA